LDIHIAIHFNPSKGDNIFKGVSSSFIGNSNPIILIQVLYVHTIGYFILSTHSIGVVLDINNNPIRILLVEEDNKIEEIYVY